ncbi:unnamed protein product [Rhodiola kirilowii]
MIRLELLCPWFMYLVRRSCLLAVDSHTLI